MTLDELKAYGYPLDTYLSHQLAEWRQCSAWWKKGGTEAADQMIRWCRSFIRFYIDVRIKRQDIEPALVRWIGGENFASLDTKAMNAPQLTCWDKYCWGVARLKLDGKSEEQSSPN